MSKMYEALQKAQQQQGATVHVYAPPLPEITEMPAANPPAAAPPISEHANGNDSSSNGMRHLPVQFSPGAVIVPWGVSNDPGGEHYRIIRTRIVQHPLRPRILAVSSAGPGDGKTISSINIAGVLSLRDNATVLLMDADFRRPSISRLLGLPAEPGLANVLSGTCTLQEAIIRVEQFPNLYVLPAGASVANSAELLDTEQWKSLCAAMRERFGFVIVDGPPIAGVADYELIQASCDGVIVVVRPDHTDRTLFNRAFDLIPENKRLGVVLNCSQQWFLWKTHESYYYAHGKQ